MKKFANLKKQPAKGAIIECAIVENDFFNKQLEWCEKHIDGVVNTPTRKSFTCYIYCNVKNGDELRVWFQYGKPCLYQY